MMSTSEREKFEEIIVRVRSVLDKCKISLHATGSRSDPEYIKIIYEFAYKVYPTSDKPSTCLEKCINHLNLAYDAMKKIINKIEQSTSNVHDAFVSKRFKFYIALENLRNDHAWLIFNKRKNVVTLEEVNSSFNPHSVLIIPIFDDQNIPPETVFSPSSLQSINK